MDLPPAGAEQRPTLASDEKLIASRRLLSVPQSLGLSRYKQVLCDSMQFDPSPYADSVQFGLIDAAHDLVHVQNDTLKMTTMMTNDGILFWHDYGGKGPLRPLAKYLEGLARQCPLYRVSGTTLAWAPARELKDALRQVGKN